MNEVKKANMELAQTILNQLGGKRFTLMVGAKNFVAGESELVFQIGRNSKKVSHVRVEYNYGKDLYVMTFLKWNARKFEYETLSKFDEVYAEDLQPFFEKETGLLTSL